MFSKVSKTANNFNSPQFFEEVFKRSLTDAYDIDINSDKIVCKRYDPKLDKDVHDTYIFESKGGGSVQFLEQVGSHYDSFPDKIPVGDKSANLVVRNVGAGLKIDRVILLSNVKAFYYRKNKMGMQNNSIPHLQNITVGIVYDDYIVPGVPKRQCKTFCFTLRNQNVTI